MQIREANKTQGASSTRTSSIHRSSLTTSCSKQGQPVQPTAPAVSYPETWRRKCLQCWFQQQLRPQMVAMLRTSMKLATAACPAAPCRRAGLAKTAQSRGHPAWTARGAPQTRRRREEAVLEFLFWRAGLQPRSKAPNRILLIRKRKKLKVRSNCRFGLAKIKTKIIKRRTKTIRSKEERQKTSRERRRSKGVHRESSQWLMILSQHH